MGLTSRALITLGIERKPRDKGESVDLVDVVIWRSIDRCVEL
jgi:hypothetical protein